MTPLTHHAATNDAHVHAGRLRVAITRLHRKLRRLPMAGLTPTQLSALVTIDTAGPLRLSDLAATEGVTVASLSRPTALLVETGYLTRETDPGDHRAARLSTTPAGQDLLQAIRTETTAELQHRLARLTAEEYNSLARAVPVLERLADAT